jgi:hypothetical protein
MGIHRLFIVISIHVDAPTAIVKDTRLSEDVSRHAGIA